MAAMERYSQQPPYCESSHAQHHCISANRAICHANVAGVSNNAISEGRHEVPSSIAASMCSGASRTRETCGRCIVGPPRSHTQLNKPSWNSLTMVHLAVYRDRLVCSLEADIPLDEMCVEARMLLEVGIVWMASYGHLHVLNVGKCQNPWFSATLKDEAKCRQHDLFSFRDISYGVLYCKFSGNPLWSLGAEIGSVKN
ncbi:hypothetical protein CGGC5_v004473 [Colletotrichum fructicola Nara gc5]|uniref:Uncharacterized protein n=1 Tax=Colletotrichum fructicola (strain Nara gc5) TaxID=1213859 RepID=A0A7J6JI10_COLFN|nr:hypothetical protein CGGC5_v004473 [Colletotrichum fructicola Nara gc5]